MSLFTRSPQNFFGALEFMCYIVGTVVNQMHRIRAGGLVMSHPIGR